MRKRIIDRIRRCVFVIIFIIIARIRTFIVSKMLSAYHLYTETFLLISFKYRQLKFSNQKIIASKYQLRFLLTTKTPYFTNLNLFVLCLDNKMFFWSILFLLTMFGSRFQRSLPLLPRLFLFPLLGYIPWLECFYLSSLKLLAVKDISKVNYKFLWLWKVLRYRDILNRWNLKEQDLINSSRVPLVAASSFCISLWILIIAN